MLTVMKSKFSLETVDSLRRLPRVDPARFGRRWKPLNHDELAVAMVDEVSSQYGRVDNLQLLLSPDRETLIGTLELPTFALDDLTRGDAYRPAAFFRHDNKQGRALQLGAGGRVFVCENGLISSDWSVKTKHEKHVDFRSWIREAVRKIAPQLRTQQEDVTYLRETAMFEPYYAFLALAVSDGLPRSLTFDAAAAWDNPPHAEFKPRTRWSWYNAVTEAAKRLAPATQTRALREAFDRAMCN